MEIQKGEVKLIMNAVEVVKNVCCSSLLKNWNWKWESYIFDLIRLHNIFLLFFV